MALAYGITHRTAATLRASQVPVVTVADDVLRRFCSTDGARAFLSVPNLFSPRGLDSTIWNRPARVGGPGGSVSSDG
jgi:hypothetical protein